MNVTQDRLEIFLQMADSLKIKGKNVVSLFYFNSGYLILV